MNTTTKTGRGKHLLMDGSDPIWGVCITPKSLRASEVAPVHSLAATHGGVSPVFPRPHSEPQPLPIVRCFATHITLRPLEDTMPLLKPPQQQLATRKLYLRIDESLAQTAERYATFLGTDKLDHVVSQALAFIFKRDTQFKQWLAEQCAAPTKTVVAKNSPKEQADEVNEGGQP